MLLERASLVAQLVKNLPAKQETGFDPWVGKIPWRRKCQPTLVILPGEFHGVLLECSFPLFCQLVLLLEGF